jgi:hypothetical protein
MTPSLLVPVPPEETAEDKDEDEFEDEFDWGTGIEESRPPAAGGSLDHSSIVIVLDFCDRLAGGLCLGSSVSARSAQKPRLRRSFAPPRAVRPDTGWK